MSHAATRWAMQQRGLKPATKIVLWALADHHNPEIGCFPEQSTLAEECEMCRASVNNHLAILETMGLIRREKVIDPATNRQRATRYFLAFDDPEAVSKNWTRDTTSSAADPEPSPEFRHGNDPENPPSRVQNLDSGRVQILDTYNPVTKNPVIKRPPPPRGPSPLLERLLDLVVVGRFDVVPKRWQGPAAEADVRRWRDDLGLTEDQIVEVALSCKSRHPKDPPRGPKALDLPMQNLAAALRAPPLAPSRNNSRPTGRPNRRIDVGAAIAAAVKEIDNDRQD